MTHRLFALLLCWPALLAAQPLTILSPQAEESIRSNSGELTIVYQPNALSRTKLGHELQVLLDQRPTPYQHDANTLRLRDVARGEHLLQLRIVDKQENTVQQSEPIRFYLLRHSQLLPRH